MSQPVAVTVEEGKRLQVPQVEQWIDALEAHSLPGGTFAITSNGKPTDLRVAIDVGIFWSIFEELGCELVSHAVQLVRVPNVLAGGTPADTTITSLLVRLPKRGN